MCLRRHPMSWRTAKCRFRRGIAFGTSSSATLLSLTTAKGEWHRFMSQIVTLKLAVPHRTPLYTVMIPLSTAIHYASCVAVRILLSQASVDWQRARCAMSNKLLRLLPVSRWTFCTSVERFIRPRRRIRQDIKLCQQSHKQKVNQIVHVNVTGNALRSIIDFSRLRWALKFNSYLLVHAYRFSRQHLVRSTGLILRVAATTQ